MHRLKRQIKQFAKLKLPIERGSVPNYWVRGPEHPHLPVSSEKCSFSDKSSVCKNIEVENG